MQEFDQEKLAEFTQQLSELQTEAAKTASVDVYDRFTISRLEDHVVDLYQLSINASHQGLQFLCECLRDNIRDHFITGTNISNQEFVLMTEWKSLVKAYLLNNDNQKVVEALTTNLSKEDWISPLKKQDRNDAIATLLGEQVDSTPQGPESNQDIKNSDRTEFDDYIEETSPSLADVFKSSNDVNEEDSLDDYAQFLEDEEPSLAECFEDLESHEDEVVNHSENISTANVDEPEIKQSLEQHEEVKQIDVSAEELSQIKQPAELLSSDEINAEDVEDQNVQLNGEAHDSQAKKVEQQLNASQEVKQIEVSEEELAEINEPSSDASESDISGDNIEQEIHVQNENTQEDDSGISVLSSKEAPEQVEVSEEELAEIKEPHSDVIESDVSGDNIEQEIHVQKGNTTDDESGISVLSSEQAPDQVEVSDEELAEIQQSVNQSMQDELFVDESHQEFSKHSENLEVEVHDHNVDALSTLDEKESLSEQVEVSEQELSEIQQSVSQSIQDELFVEDSELEVSAESENFEAEAQDVDALYKLDESNTAAEDIKVSQEELADITTPEAEDIENQIFLEHNHAANIEEEVQIELSTPDYSDVHAEAREKNLLEIAEAEKGYKDETSDNSMQQEGYVEYAESINQISNEVSDNQEIDSGDMTIAEEAIFGSQHASIDDASGFVDTSVEEVLQIPEAQNEVSDLEETNDFVDVDSNANVETVYIEPIANTQTQEPRERRSIIEAYTDVIASKQKQNKPDELEQELIEKPAIDESKVELEPVENILEKYSDWNEEQKELLSLILSEVADVIEQQSDTLKVLHDTPANEESVLDMISLYTEQIERMGSAAEMVGLDALQKICELIGFHFVDLSRASTEMIVKSEELISRWPFVIYAYLKDIYDENAHQKAVDYISHSDWARTIREDIKSDLKQAFEKSSISIEHDEDDQRLTTAAEEHVDISVPTDVQAELLDGLLQELPHQTEELSSAIQALIGEDYLSQLEVSQRIAHTIKGAANTVGIVGVATLTHQLEDILEALLKSQAKPSTGLHNALVDAADCLEQMTEFLQDQGERPEDAVQTLQVILDWANYIDEFGAPKSDEHEVSVSANSSDNQQDDKKADADKGKSAQEASLRVPANMIDELINQSGESIIANSQMHENVTRLLHSLRDIKKNREDVYTMSQQLEHMIDVQGVLDKFTVSKKDEKFDPLELDQYNELHTYSRRLIEATADSVELIKDLEERLYGLETVIADQSRAQRDNQYAILKARMAPVDSIIARLKRGVRQSSKISQKSVELEVLGSDTLLDSKILNNLVDPLMHLLRNAVDHGVETDEVRREQGKPIPAIITLAFEQVGERLEISCQDDGRGLDAENITARAIDKGLITADQELSEKQIHQIIMSHGFSTRDEVTQLSGRGVGMDVVHSNIKELNGSVQIQSEKNKGMTVEMSLPVSLLTAHVLLIPTRDGTMAVSTSGIEEILQVNSDDLIESDNSLTLKIEQGEFAAVYLEQLLKIPLIENHSQKKYSALLIDNIGGDKKVVLVSEIQSVRDIIIKPFSHYLPKVDGLIGATVLGNGDVAAVVDVSDLLTHQSELVGRLNQDASTDLEVIHQASVLVVEDSISTRRSLAEFMQDLNYKVFTAKDGVEAVEIMRQHVPSIVLTDLEMPRMNGLELTSYVRSHDETRDIPVIMLTSRTTEKHKQEAKSIGVNEYLTKPFVEDILLEKVQHLAEAK